MQDIREIELRDNGSNTNTKICFEIRATALRSHLHTEEFSLYSHRTFHKGTSTKDYNTTPRVHNFSSLTQTPLHKREGIKPSTK